MKHRPAPPSRYRGTGQLINSGAYGDVELWHDDMLDRDVAIKWLTSTDGEEQFLNEWRMLATAASRHVVEIYDLVFDKDGVLCGIVMEYIDGRPLGEVHPPTTDEQLQMVIKLLYQFAVGLADIHAQGIIHRDVKPDNAITAANGKLKICDFGLSAMDEVATLQARGTMGYKGAEYFTKPVTLTQKSDCYAFGAVCWKVLTGGLPPVGKYGFPDEHNFPLPSIRSKVSGISSRLAAFIDGCLTFNPETRLDMAVVAQAFRAELIFNRHNGSVALSNGLVTINSNKTTGRIAAGTNSIEVTYNGYDFSVRAVGGDVFINNSRAAVGMLLTEGCIITFGAMDLGPQRAFAPFRQFTPEVVI